MAKIITDDATLRVYIPNAFSTIDDETPLYEKLSPFLEAAESWLETNLTGETVLNKIADDKSDARFTQVAMFIVSRAFAMAVPSLDLVLTPNGFGIVSNNNIAPASKERVERLIDSLHLTEARSMAALYPLLRHDPDWHNSKQCEWIAESIIQDLDLVKTRAEKFDSNANLWDLFLTFRQKAYPIEQEIANGWISPQLMARLRKCVATATYDSDKVISLTNLILNVVITAINTGNLKKRLLDDAVSFIRNFPALFPEWHNSATAELFSPPLFENDKISGGYFF